MKAPHELEKPIFLVGCAKSGTTLVSLLLSMHPRLGFGMPGKILSMENGQESIDSLLETSTFNRIMSQIERKEVWNRFFPIPPWIQLTMGSELVEYKCQLTDAEVSLLKESLSDGLMESRLLAKQPLNTFRVHVLREIFPDSKIVAIQRDGRDVIASWGSKSGHSWEKLGGYDEAIEIFSRKWNESIDHIEAFREDLDIYVLRYESLVKDPVGELQKLFEFCDLENLPELYQNITLQYKSGSWVTTIPAEYHHQVDRLTYRNRRRLGYLLSEFDELTETPCMIQKSSNFSDYYASSLKRMHECPICNSRQFRRMADVDRHDIGLITSICTLCGLVQCNPRCSDEWYEEFYRKSFWGLYIGNQDISLDELYISDEQDYKGEEIGKFLLERVKHTVKVKDYLDIGCGLGGLAINLKRMIPKMNVTVVDPSSDAVNFIASRVQNITINQHSIENMESLDSSSFDLISMIHVLEHVQNPLTTLLEVRRLLRKGGVAYIEVPEFLNDNWKGKNYLHIAHKFIFDRDTLSKLVNSAGLEVIDEFPSPVRKLWPWAFGFIVTASNAPVRTLDKMPEAEIDRRVGYMKEKLSSRLSWNRWRKKIDKLLK